MTNDIVEKINSTIRSMDLGCHRVDGRQIRLRNFYEGASQGEHLEIDMVCLVNNVCIFIEVTSQERGNRNKIRRFITHCNLIMNSSLNEREKFRILGIPSKHLGDFEEVEDYKFAYFSDSYELLDNDITVSRFPDQFGKLAIFNIYDITYLISLTKMVKKYAKPEFLSNFQIPVDPSTAILRSNKDFVEIKNRFLSPGVPRATVYLVYFTPKELLNTCRVFRYGGILVPLGPSGTIEESEGKYQRILIESKLKDIAEDFINDDHKVSFPTTVTLVLRSRPTFDENGNIIISSNYGSIDIIDGQHRIFSYANENYINDRVRERAKIFATVIYFGGFDTSSLNKYTSKLFFEINSKQTKVKRNLLYLVKYDVLGEKDAVSIAGKIILDIDKNGNFKRIFLTNPLMKENILKLRPIPIVTIIDELSKMLDIKELSEPENEERKEHFEEIFDNDLSYFKRYPQKIYEKGKSIVDNFFGYIKYVYEEDWKDNSDSNLFCAKYIAAMIRFLKYFLIERGNTLEEVKTKLEILKTNVRVLCNAQPTDETFKADFEGDFKEGEGIPNKKSSVKDIYDFFKNNLSS